MPSTRPLKHPVIVLVEEETEERRAIGRHLHSSGFTVLEAGTTDDAMTYLEVRRQVHGLVTDAHVPGRIDGYELASHVRRLRPDIAVVMMSGHSDSTSGPLPDGAEFVSKPYLASHLVPALNLLLGRFA